MTATMINTVRWQIQRTERKPGHIVLGNATRPAMLVVEDGRMIERRRAARDETIHGEQ